MKNYLFAPFKDDEKIAYFNKLKINLDVNGLTMFIGRLESYYDVIISKLQDKLQSVNDDYNNDHKVHNDYADGLLEEIKELKKELKEKDKQYHMLASSRNDTTHYPKEYKDEASEYFEHNEHCKELLFFMIEDNNFNDDEFNDCLYKDDAIAVIYNAQ